MSRWSALDTNFNLPDIASDVTETVSGSVPETVQGEKVSQSQFPVFGIALFMVVAIGIAVAISLSGSKKPLPSSSLEELNVVQTQVLQEEPVKAIEKVADRVSDHRVSVKRSSIWLDTDDSIEEPFVHTEKGHTFQEYAQTLESGRQTFRSERPDGPGANLDYLKHDLKKKGLGLQDFVDSFGVSVPDAFVDSWTSETKTKVQRTQNTLSSSSDMSESEMRQLAQEATQNVPLGAATESVAIVLREIHAARTEASQVGLNLGPMDPQQRSAIESIANGNSKASSIAKTILSRS